MTAATPITRPSVDIAPSAVVKNGNLTTGSVTIANGASLSGAIDLENFRLGRIIIPAAWTAANLTFQTSPDDGTYSDLYDAAGYEYTIVVGGASRAIIVPLADFIGIRFLKIRSGTAGVAVNQAADRVLTLVVVP